jgi:hypothetical protein
MHPPLRLNLRLREVPCPLTLADDLQIPKLRLHRLQVTSEAVYPTMPIERRAWFLCHADKLTTDEIGDPRRDPEFSEATEVQQRLLRRPKNSQPTNHG